MRLPCGIAIASDHAAVALKAELVQWLAGGGHEVIDLGPQGIDSVDYPDFGYKLAEEIAAGGPSAASRCAAPASASRSPPTAIPPAAARGVDEPLSARLAREHNDANVIAHGRPPDRHRDGARRASTASSPPLSAAAAISAGSTSFPIPISPRKMHEQPRRSATSSPTASSPTACAHADGAVADAIAAELDRQQNQIELIASENIVSRAVLEAQGSVLTNKYAEGYPGRRYYQGCAPSDAVETLAIERAKQLFGCGFANVQPHTRRAGQRRGDAGADQAGRHDPRHVARRRRPPHPWRQAGHVGQMVQRRPIWRPPATIICIDFDQVERLAKEHRPALIIAGGSAYPRHIDFARFRAIADEVGAIFMCDMAHFAGLVAAGEHPTPFGHAHVVTTTTHKTLRGPRGGMVLTDDEAIAKKINSAVFPGLQGGPLMHVIAAKAVAFGEALQPDFKTYARR